MRNGRITKLAKLVHFLNNMPLKQPMFQNALVREMSQLQRRTYRNYLGLLKREGFIRKEGRGRAAVVSRHKRIPAVKLYTTITER